MGYDSESIADMIRFIYAAGHMCIGLLAAILGWQK